MPTNLIRVIGKQIFPIWADSTKYFLQTLEFFIKRPLTCINSFIFLIEIIQYFIMISELRRAHETLSKEASAELLAAAKPIKDSSKYLRYVFTLLFCVVMLLLVPDSGEQVTNSSEANHHTPRILTNYYELELTPRVELEQPKPQQTHMILWKIKKLKNQNLKSKKNPVCPFINSINIVTQNTYRSVKQLLDHKDFKSIFMMTDISSKNEVKQIFRSYETESFNVKLDSDFDFLRTLQDECIKLVYMFGSFKLDSKMVVNIAEEADSLPDSSLYFSAKCIQKSEEKSLDDLSTSNLIEVEQKKFYRYLYIFNSEFLNLILPVNFIYYNMYTLEEIFLIPLLVLYQSSNKMIPSTKIMHSFAQSFIQNKYFALKSLPKEDDSMCFISYPEDLRKVNKNTAIEYLNSISQQSVVEQNMVNARVIVYLPYSGERDTNIFDVARHLLEMTDMKQSIRGRVALVANKISPGYAAYQSAYSFCPNHTMIVASRHNVKFDKHVTTWILSSTSVKYHYYLFNFRNELGNQTILTGKVSFFKEFNNKTGTLFQDHLRHIQVFKSDLMKMVPLWLLKNDQIDFYDTEAPFVYCMMQTITNDRLYYINHTLATVRTRDFSELEEKQISNLKYYSTYSPLNEDYMMPYFYNSLENPALSRNAPKIIPPIIHQIWVGKQKISDFKMKLRSSIIKTNPNFQVLLWKSQNITKQLLPITYNLITLITEKNKDKTASLMAMAADLMRYQLLIIYGGIYLDFKFQGHKPLDNFLKYKLLFTDLDISAVRFGRPKTLGNGFLGAPPNSYFLKIALHQLMAQHTLNFVENLPHVTGSYKLRRLLTDHEVFTQIGLGYHLAIPHPYEQKKNYCGGVNQEHFDFDQQIFEVQIPEFPAPVKIGSPCKLYPQAFLILVSPLKGTWLKKEQKK